MMVICIYTGTLYTFGITGLPLDVYIKNTIQNIVQTFSYDRNVDIYIYL